MCYRSNIYTQSAYQWWLEPCLQLSMTQTLKMLLVQTFQVPFSK